MRIPDLTRADGGIGHCRRLAFGRIKGSALWWCDITVEYAVPDDEGAQVELPASFQHARGAFLAALAGAKGATKVEHVPLTEGAVSLCTMVDGERYPVLTGRAGTVRKAVLHAVEKRPRVVYTLRVEVLAETAPNLLECIESDVDVAFAPSQAELAFVEPAVVDDLDDVLDENGDVLREHDLPPEVSTTRKRAAAH